MDEKAFAASVRGMEEAMYRVAVSLLWDDARAAEAIEACIVKAWQRRNCLQDTACLERWMLRLLVGQCRRRRGRNGCMQASADPAVRAALRKVPVRYRLPLMLRETLTVEDTAWVLRLPVRTAKKRIQTAQKLLCRALREEVD